VLERGAIAAKQGSVATTTTTTTVEGRKEPLVSAEEKKKDNTDAEAMNKEKISVVGPMLIEFIRKRRKSVNMFKL
jgi:hypothetical protein